MSKGGGKGGSSGSGEVSDNPRFAGNSSLWQQEQGLTDLTEYEQSLLNPIASEANWAENIATGGNAEPLGYATSGDAATGFLSVLSRSIRICCSVRSSGVGSVALCATA